MILQSPLPVLSAGATVVRREGFARALLALTKPRLAFFSILSGMTGYAVASAEGGWPRLLASLAGITLSAGGALSLNQWWERDTDALMRRTAGRPLPSGRISPAGALIWTLTLSLAGVGLLAGTTGVLAASLAAAIIVLYGLIYTPMKRMTRWATEVGSVSGAMPPLLGAAAAGEVMAPGAWVLAGILLFWQMPHFFAIGWMHRVDYRTAGFPLRPVIDATGGVTAAWSLAYTVALAVVSLLPWALGTMGWIYGIIALAGALAMLVNAVRFLTDGRQRDLRARRLFLTTLIYLPPVMAALVMDAG
jgi:protoheme IX farnesyltransferase